ncbi:VWA domain-containing protein [Deinococcus psychrotolerans]|uniref:VWA domain-containing protein n=1 Tax=Deinococcus psychrotolerans TaxID=2489213 RepID=A0A3G8YC46_9DEIO|nr:VWA domain-containing protein [Deinococcus psychrotolerans]AZI41777.1 VWA domain-containing protein [Deinococcus psychrotolerans]
MAQGSALLPELTAFVAKLRRAGFSAGPSELAGALRAAEALGLLDLAALETAWGIVFARSKEQAELFVPLFRAHFLKPDLPAPPQSDAVQPQPSEDDSPPSGDAEPLPAQQQGAAEAEPLSPDVENASEAAQWLQTRLSPHAAQGAPPSLSGDAQLYAQAARALLGVRLGHSRRFRPTPLGQRIDLRATLQSARQTGGEAIRLRRKGRPPRPPKVVLVLDGSRSMAPYAALLLRYAAALSVRSRSVEVYAFSTSLTRLTPLLRAGQVAPAMQLGQSWGGGTRIGENLERLLREGKAALRPTTLLLILSDGLDTGEPAQLAGALSKLRRRVGGVIWLNPLAAQDGYQPLARGMAAALPALDVFVGVEDAADLLALPKKVQRALR